MMFEDRVFSTACMRSEAPMNPQARDFLLSQGSYPSLQVVAQVLQLESVTAEDE